MRMAPGHDKARFELVRAFDEGLRYAIFGCEGMYNVSATPLMLNNEG